MKTRSIILFFLVAVTLCPTNGKAQGVKGICLFNFKWDICIQPNGQASACYGSIGEDCLTVNEGTVDFHALLLTLDTAKRKITPEPGDFQISIHREGEQIISSFAITDDAVIRRFLITLEKKWKPKLPGSRIKKSGRETL